MIGALITLTVATATLSLVGLTNDGYLIAHFSMLGEPEALVYNPGKVAVKYLLQR